MTESMHSEGKVAANRANARHSTGPRTPEGKARSSQNATKHGLYSEPNRMGPDGTLAPKMADLLSEEQAAFDARLQGLRGEYSPEEPHEERMVARLAMFWWRLERVDALVQARLAARLAQGVDPLDAVMEAERLSPIAAPLEKAIARLHKQLLFLRRDREREQRHSAKDSARREVADFVAQIEAESEFLMQRARQRYEAQDDEEQDQAAPDYDDAHGFEGSDAIPRSASVSQATREETDRVLPEVRPSDTERAETDVRSAA